MKQIQQINSDMQDAKEAFNEMEVPWEKKLEEEKQRNEDLELKRKESMINVQTLPHLSNLHQDDQLNCRLKYSLTNLKETLVGRKSGNPKPTIVLGSIGIKPNHAVFTAQLISNEDQEEKKEYTVSLRAWQPQCHQTIYVNGENIDPEEPRTLKHNDRILFGTSSYFLFKNPQNQGAAQELPKGVNQIDFEFAQNEQMQRSAEQSTGVSGIAAQIYQQDALGGEIMMVKQLTEGNLAQISGDFEVVDKVQEMINKESVNNASNNVTHDGLGKPNTQNTGQMNDQMYQQLQQKKQKGINLTHSEQSSQGEIMSNPQVNNTNLSQELIHQEIMKKEEQHNLVLAQTQEKHQDQTKELFEKIKNLQKELTVKVQNKHEEDNNQMKEKIKKLMPSVREANIISKDLNRKIKFSAKLVNILPEDIKDPQMLAIEQKTDILVTVHNNEKGMVYHWKRDKFQNRLDMMRQLEEQYFDEGQIEPLDEQNDPFWDPQAQQIGNGYYILKPLSYLIDNPVTIKIIGDEQESCGRLQVNIIPQDETGEQDPPQQDLPQEPKQLIGQNIHFKVEIIRAIDLPSNFCKNVYVEYKIFKEEEVHQTIVSQGKNQNPEFNFSKFHSNYMVTEKFLEYLLTSTVKLFFNSLITIRCASKYSDSEIPNRRIKIALSFDKT